MRSWLQALRPSGGVLKKVMLLLAVAGVGIGAFCWGRLGVPQTEAAQPQPVSEVAATPSASLSDYQSRVVAYIYGNTAVSRAELGEYLIARFGAERLEFLVNRKIVETECAKRGITVSDAEVQAQLRLDLRGFNNISEKDFVTHVLKRFNKTLYEWKEDVIRPKLMLTKLVRPTITVDDADLLKAFEARYGPKVKCRMIVLNNDKKIAEKVWEEARKGEKTFKEQAAKQPIAALAAHAGEVPPVHKHFGDDKVEQAAFGMKEGEISPLMQLKDGSWLILRCEKHLPRDPGKRFETERAQLLNEVREAKLNLRIPEVFRELRERAAPKLLITNPAAPAVPLPPPLAAGTPSAAQAPQVPSPSLPAAPGTGLTPRGN